jgi:hypothetical protein
VILLSMGTFCRERCEKIERLIRKRVLDYLTNWNASSHSSPPEIMCFCTLTNCRDQTETHKQISSLGRARVYGTFGSGFKSHICFQKVLVTCTAIYWAVSLMARLQKVANRTCTGNRNSRTCLQTSFTRNIKVRVLYRPPKSCPVIG